MQTVSDCRVFSEGLAVKIADLYSWATTLITERIHAKLSKSYWKSQAGVLIPFSSQVIMRLACWPFSRENFLSLNTLGWVVCLQFEATWAKQTETFEANF
jgi:hypothetical protein